MSNPPFYFHQPHYLYTSYLMCIVYGLVHLDYIYVMRTSHVQPSSLFQPTTFIYTLPYVVYCVWTCPLGLCLFNDEDKDMSNPPKKVVCGGCMVSA